MGERIGGRMRTSTKATTRDALQLLQDGSIALSQVESNGMCMDVSYLNRAVKKIEGQIKHHTQELHSSKIWKAWVKRYGNKANVDSGKQLGNVLFTDMKYKCKFKTKTGLPKTDKATLEKLKIPFVKKYLRIKGLKKVRSTYLKGLLRETVDGFIHPSFNLHIPVTYRSSCQDPNIQNMPIRDNIKGKIIREAFVSRFGEDGHIVENDFKGIEVAVACCYHKDPTMVEYLEDKSKDMHRDMAQQCFMIKRKKHVEKLVRYAGKNSFVFPQFYGSWYLECAKHLWEAIDELDLQVNGVPMKKHLRAQGIKKLGDCIPGNSPRPHTFEKHIQTVEKDFWKRRFKIYDKWRHKRYEEYVRDGYFETLTGFSIAGDFVKNEVINYPVQGSAFHCLLWTLIKVQKEMTKRGMRSVIIGQIHDSIIADIHKDELQEYLNLVKHVASVLLPQHWKWITVPLDIEAEVAPLGKSWFYKKEWLQNKKGTWRLPPEKKGKAA